jgi:hypothetical protein
MGRKSIGIGLVISAAALAGCGSTSHASSSTNSSRPPAPTGSPATRTGLQAKVLMPGELHGFDVAAPMTASNPQAWVAINQFPAGQRSATVGRLRRLGFTGGVREDLTWAAPRAAGSATPPAAGLSVVERFRTPADARSELTAELPTLGPGTALKVVGVPGGRGYSSTGAGQDFANVLFASGPDLYLVGAEWPTSLKGKMSVRDLVAAAQHEYQRTRQ